MPTKRRAATDLGPGAYGDNYRCAPATAYAPSPAYERKMTWVWRAAMIFTFVAFSSTGTLLIFVVK